ncbi:uncharacterized protein LOC134209953 [Armigeres subalbatus]|uniref:uncharacterized protein LOC134209953 n=1 Tax=Armigeres subalbatus TaxID=124917 RepID=UPI002ED0B73E
MRCYRCWEFGHTGSRCTSPVQICGNCGEHHQLETAMATDEAHPAASRQPCPDQQQCKFCKTNNHPTSIRKCPLYLKEVEVQRVKVDRGITYPQARKEVEALSGSGQSSSFARVASSSKDQEIQELRKKVSELQAAAKPKQTSIGNRLEAIQKNGTIEDLVEKVASLTQVVSKLQESISVKDKIIEKLRDKINNPSQ